MPTKTPPPTPAEKYAAQPETQLLREIRKRAPCTLTAADLRTLFAPMRCAVTGLDLKRSAGAPSPLSPSIDRIDPDGPYSIANVRLVAYGFNALRGRAPVAKDAEIAARFTTKLRTRSTDKAGKVPASPDEYRASRRAKDRRYSAAYYAEHRDAILARRRSRYAHDAEHREAHKRHKRETYAARKLAPVAAYRLGYAAGLRDAAANNDTTPEH